MVWIEDGYFDSVVHFCCSNSLCFYGMSHSCVRASEYGPDVAETDSRGFLSERWYIIVGLA